MIVQHVKNLFAVARDLCRDLIHWFVFGALALGLLAGMFATVQPTHAAGARLVYHRGYSVQGSWLCYGWSNGALHCTQHWKRSGSGFVSFNPRWVPSSVSVKTASATPATGGSSSVLRLGPCAGQSVSFSGVSAWKAPNGCYSRVFWEPNQGYPSYGWCSYWAEAMHPWLGKTYTALHLPSHSAPRVGATIYYSPGVAGASSAGHYGVVVAIGPSGWLLTSEMNFVWRGGGWQKVDYRYVHIQPGMSFRY